MNSLIAYSLYSIYIDLLMVFILYIFSFIYFLYIGRFLNSAKNLFFYSGGLKITGASWGKNKIFFYFVEMLYFMVILRFLLRICFS